MIVAAHYSATASLQSPSIFSSPILAASPPSTSPHLIPSNAPLPPFQPVETALEVGPLAQVPSLTPYSSAYLAGSPSSKRLSHALSLPSPPTTPTASSLSESSVASSTPASTSPSLSVYPHAVVSPPLLQETTDSSSSSRPPLLTRAISSASTPAPSSPRTPSAQANASIHSATESDKDVTSQSSSISASTCTERGSNQTVKRKNPAKSQTTSTRPAKRSKNLAASQPVPGAHKSIVANSKVSVRGAQSLSITGKGALLKDAKARRSTSRWKKMEQPCAYPADVMNEVTGIIEALCSNTKTNHTSPACTSWINNLVDSVIGRGNWDQRCYSDNSMTSIATRCRDGDNLSLLVHFIRILHYVHLAFKIDWYVFCLLFSNDSEINSATNDEPSKIKGDCFL